MDWTDGDEYTSNRQHYPQRFIYFKTRKDILDLSPEDYRFRCFNKHLSYFCNFNYKETLILFLNGIYFNNDTNQNNYCFWRYLSNKLNLTILKHVFYNMKFATLTQAQVLHIVFKNHLIYWHAHFVSLISWYHLGMQINVAHFIYVQRMFT